MNINIIKNPQKVAIALIHDNNQCVLITQRPPTTSFAGYWEFPGGKQEAGESIEQTLVREIQEELGVLCENFSPVCEFITEQNVLLCIFEVTKYHGVPIAKEGQLGLQWLSWDQLHIVKMLPTNEKIIQFKLSCI